MTHQKMSVYNDTLENKCFARYADCSTPINSSLNALQVVSKQLYPKFERHMSF